MKYVVAHETETHTDQITEHVIHIDILIGVRQDEAVFVEIMIGNVVSRS